jgi:hypothetical protein
VVPARIPGSGIAVLMALLGSTCLLHPHSSSFTSHDSCLKSQSQLAAVAIVSVVVVVALVL